MAIPPSGERVRCDLCNVIELRDGKIYGEHDYFEALAMLIQIGAGPPIGATMSA